MLPDPICASAETLGGNCKIVGLVLKGIKTLAALGDFVDVVAHHTDCVVDLLERSVVSLKSDLALIHSGEERYIDA